MNWDHQPAYNNRLDARPELRNGHHLHELGNGLRFGETARM
jgi:hypothetical protein